MSLSTVPVPTPRRRCASRTCRARQACRRGRRCRRSGCSPPARRHAAPPGCARSSGPCWLPAPSRRHGSAGSPPRWCARGRCARATRTGIRAPAAAGTPASAVARCGPRSARSLPPAPRRAGGAASALRSGKTARLPGLHAAGLPPAAETARQRRSPPHRAPRSRSDRRPTSPGSPGPGRRCHSTPRDRPPGRRRRSWGCGRPPAAPCSRAAGPAPSSAGARSAPDGSRLRRGRGPWWGWPSRGCRGWSRSGSDTGAGQ